eukprot:2616847-Pyramimonas_sp.AAC.1
MASSSITQVESLVVLMRGVYEEAEYKATPHKIGVDEDLEAAAKETTEAMKAKQQYAIKGADSEWDELAKKGTLKTTTVSIKGAPLPQLHSHCLRSHKKKGILNYGGVTLFCHPSLINCRARCTKRSLLPAWVHGSKTPKKEEKTPGKTPGKEKGSAKKRQKEDKDTGSAIKKSKKTRSMDNV